METFKEITDKDIIEVFLLEEKQRENKLIHGIQRKNGEVIVIFESLGLEGHTGFSEKFHLEIPSLSERQLGYLKGKGYSFSHEE
jgi:hypothetical protein